PAALPGRPFGRGRRALGDGLAGAPGRPLSRGAGRLVGPGPRLAVLARPDARLPRVSRRLRRDPRRPGRPRRPGPQAPPADGRGRGRVGRPPPGWPAASSEYQPEAQASECFDIHSLALRAGGTAGAQGRKKVQRVIVMPGLPSGTRTFRRYGNICEPGETP